MHPLELLPFLIIIGALVSFIIQMLNILWHNRRRQETTEDRVKRLTKSLEESVGLIGAIESEIRARSALAKQLEEDIERYNNLVELKKPEVEAISQLLRGELAREGRAYFWKGFAVNFLFFVLGVASSMLITKWAK